MAARAAPADPDLLGDGRRAATGRVHLAFWFAGGLLALALASTTAPSILYRRYEADWHFSSAVTTAVFGVYSITVIAALLLTGSASDAGRRKPFIMISLALSAASMILFLAADGVGWLFVARIVQGLGVGVGLSVLGGMLLDLRPGGRQGAFVNQAAPNVGMIVGALGTGALVDFGPRPTVVVYALLLAVFLVALPLVLVLPETAAATPRTGAVLSKLSLPAGRHREFWLISLAAIATWAVGGFYLSLGPTASAQVLHSDSFTVNGIAIAVLGGAALLAQVLCYGWSFEREMVVGASLLGLGIAGVLYSMWPNSAFFFFAGSVVLSFGWGLTAIGSFRSVVALAHPTRRAEVVAAVYVVSYLAFSLPAVAAGYATERFGLRSTMVVFGMVVTAMALVAAVTAVKMRPAWRPE
jgi:MFS family permease